MRAAEELDEARNNTTRDNSFYRGILLLGQKLAELGGALQLLIDIVRHNTGDHLGKVVIELGLCQHSELQLHIRCTYLSFQKRTTDFLFIRVAIRHSSLGGIG